MNETEQELNKSQNGCRDERTR